jgi:hypothetical protein
MTRRPALSPAARVRLRDDAERERRTRRFLGEEAVDAESDGGLAHDLADDDGTSFDGGDVLDLETARVRGFRAVEEA